MRTLYTEEMQSSGVGSRKRTDADGRDKNKRSKSLKPVYFDRRAILKQKLSNYSFRTKNGLKTILGGVEMIKLTIPGEPCAKQRPRLGKGYTYTPQKTVNYETLVRQLYITQNFRKQLEGALKMTVRAYFAIPKSDSNKKAYQKSTGIIRPTKRPDWDNVGKVISDALNGLAYHDDSQIVSATVEKWYSFEPRIEVILMESEVEHDA